MHSFFVNVSICLQFLSTFTYKPRSVELYAILYLKAVENLGYKV